MFIKECEKNFKCKKKEILNLPYEKGLLLEKSKDFDKFKEMYKKNGESKISKSVRKVSKSIKIGNEFSINMLKQF